MASMHDLIEQIEDKRERERFRQVWEESIREKKFGLVFEPHLPELLPLPKVKPRRGDLVCMREGSLKDLWRVRRVANGVAFCVKPGAEGQGGVVDPVQFSTDELLVVRQFGEPIFPALVPVDQVQNGEAGTPWHTLIESDNFHALQLLDYLYAGKVDCIYIDPPYNTGARDWKYNNNYVDKNDSWRHSKWIAMMARRLKIAERLLKPDGCLIITIDDYEAASLALWLDEEMSQWVRTPVVIRYNRQGTPRSGLFRTHEYAFFLTQQDLARNPRGAYITTRNFRRNGTNSTRAKRWKMFFPIRLHPSTLEFLEAGLPPEDSWHPKAQTVVTKDYVEIWPIDDDGAERCWQWGYEAVRRRHAELEFRWQGDHAHAYFKTSNLPILDYETVLVDPLYDAATHGSSLVQEIIGRNFPFPKSMYAVKTCIEKVLWNRPNALVVDFFAGSGTTLHAVNLQNAVDGGRRRCILVTNNEVSGDDAEELRGEGLHPGDERWEARGIARSVTWPRSKFSILGRRDDGSAIPGDYFTGKTVEREKPRNFTQIGFVDPALLDTAAKKKQLVALIDGLPQTLVKNPCDFIVSEEHKASVLFDPSAADEWLEALDGQDHITDFYIVTPTKRVFESLKAMVVEQLGPLLVPEDEKRPMRAGFTANLAYFKLDFLDKDRVALKQAFKEVLPMLWLKAGAVGPRPELPRGVAEPPFFDPSGANFAVLLDEGVFRKFVKTIGKRTDLSVVYIVTDADEAFKDMADEVRHALRLSSPSVEVVQLYKDYLANFLINTRLDLDLNGQGGQA